MALIVKKKHFLYVLADDGADAAVIQFNSDLQTARKVDDVHFPDAQNPVRFDTVGSSVVTSGAVLPTDRLIPIFRGAFEIETGIFATVWGYDNQNAYIVQTVPVLSFNFLTGGTAQQQENLPELFVPGEVEVAFVVFTEGETLTWDLETSGGIEASTTDYDIPANPDIIRTVAPFVTRRHYPAFLRYTALDILNVSKVAQEKFGKITLNNAGLDFDSTTVIRHTEEVNDDIPGQSAWYGRDLACRMEGGEIQAHANAGRVSRVLFPELAPELDRGVW